MYVQCNAVLTPPIGARRRWSHSGESMRLVNSKEMWSLHGPSLQRELSRFTVQESSHPTWATYLRTYVFGEQDHHPAVICGGVTAERAAPEECEQVARSRDTYSPVPFTKGVRTLVLSIRFSRRTYLRFLSCAAAGQTKRQQSAAQEDIGGQTKNPRRSCLRRNRCSCASQLRLSRRSPQACVRSPIMFGSRVV